MITGSGHLTYDIVDDWAHIPEELGGLDQIGRASCRERVLVQV